MHNIEELKKEKESCRKNIVKFSILTGVSILVAIITIIIYVVGMFIVSSSMSMSANEIAAAIGVLLIFYIVFLLLSICGVLAFTPFIVINGIKYGKRRRLIDKIESEGAINA